MQAHRFVRFLLVGGLNAAFGYGVFALLTWVGLPYPVAIAIATVLGIAFNYQSTGRLVFGGAPGAGPGRAARFTAMYAVVYLVNIGGVAALLRIGLNVYVANALLVLPLALLSYVLQRKFVFTAP